MRRMFLSSKAQVAMEYMIIIGFVAVITLPLIIIFQSHSQETSDEIISTQVYQLSKKIADASETVYYLGEPSRLTIKAYLPEGINSIDIGSNEIVFKVKWKSRENEIVVYTPVTINGSLSPTQGIHYISVESKGDYVWVEG